MIYFCILTLAVNMCVIFYAICACKEISGEVYRRCDNFIDCREICYKKHGFKICKKCKRFENVDELAADLEVSEIMSKSHPCQIVSKR